MRKGVNKVALRLFEHNEKAYHAAVRMMEQYGNAAIVHPTGTGKSYIALKLIEDNPEKVVIWLSPSEYIFKTQLESLKRNDPDFPLANVYFYTCAKLVCSTQTQLDEIAAQKPAYILLDEFHRAGAECWGESTVALLKLCPDAKLLGLTATNIRYLDNNRDMAEELFDSRVASNMTLGEAVVRGILPTPKYVTTVYQYQKTRKRLQSEMQEVVHRLYANGEGDKIVTERFEVIEQGHDCRVLFEQLQASLSSGWEHYFSEASIYYAEHGNLNVPAEYVSPNGYNLGNWVKRQRYTHQNPEKSCAVLTEERIAKLDAIGMRWEKSNPKRSSRQTVQAETVTAKAG